MATITAAGAGNWSAGATWTGGVKPGNGDTADLNGKAVVLDENTATLVAIQSSNASGKLTVSGTRVLTGNVNHSSTSTAGMIVVPTGTAVTINGGVTNTSSGYAIVTSGAASVTIYNPGGTAVSSSAGRGVSWGSTSGTLSITGLTTGSGGSTAVRSSTGGTISFVGDITTTGAVASYGLSLSSGWSNSVTIAGNIYRPNDSTGSPLSSATGTGTITWTGARSVPASTEFYMLHTGGTLDLTSLVLSNSGYFCLNRTAGTVTVGSGGTLAQINNMSATASGVILGKGLTTTFALDITPYSSGSGSGGRRKHALTLGA